MPHLTRRSLLALPALALALPARAQDAPEAQRIPIELVEEALELEAGIRIGNPGGDVTMVEFFDYNCGFCRRSARDLAPLLAGDPDLAYVLMNFAVLGLPSVEATRVSLAMLELHGPARAAALHEALFGLRGPVTGERALNAAIGLGADARRIAKTADSERITRRMRRTLTVGNALGLAATPAFVVGPWAWVGDLDLNEKRRLVAQARA